MNGSPKPLHPATSCFAKRGKGAFALVLSVTLLAFLVLVFVILASILQNTAATTAQQSFLTIARQNALAGANIALGELQMQAGPDQRATATADLFATTDAANGKIVGVWNADPLSADFGERLAWLVSGDATDVTVPPQDSWPLLVSERGTTPPVRARPENFVVDGEDRGRFAWWIADEGVKASAVLTPSARDAGDPRRWRAAHRFGMELMDGFSAVENPEDWVRVNAREQVGFLGDDAVKNAVDANFHDFTVRAEGVLTNVRAGGLKRDLTAALDQTATDPDGSTPIFPPQHGGSAQNDPGGPLWSQLRSFYNTRVTGNTGAGSISLQAGGPDSVTIAPVLTHAQVYGHALRRNAAGTSFRFYVMPGFGLWNPYQHVLTTEGFWISYRPFANDWTWSLKAQENDTPSASLVLPRVLSWYVPPTTWEPGEIKFFSLDQHRFLPTFYATAPTANVTLSEGWFEGFGNYRDVAASPAMPGNYWLETSNPGGYVDVLFGDRPNREASGGNAAGVFVRTQGLTSAVPEDIPALARTEITGAGLAPGLTDSLLAANPGQRFPALGWRAVMKFARMTELSMTFAPGRAVDPPAPFETLFLGHYNPRAVHSFYPGGEARYPYYSNPLYAAQNLRTDIGAPSTEYPDTGIYAAGFSGSLPSSDTAAYFEFLRPDEPVFGIGRLMQAALSRAGGGLPEAFDAYIPAFAIGNSLADPRVPPDQTFRSWEGFGSAVGTHYDYSYLLNEALWDDYFFSAIPRSGPLDQNAPFDHPRLRIFGEASPDDLRSADRAAQSLLVQGAFNVNSTSVEAWKALLGSFWGENVETVEAVEAGQDFSSFSRYSEPLARAWTAVDNELDNRTHGGFRRLSQAQISSLATEIVNSLRGRATRMEHPFLSLAQFVNRALIPPAADPNDHRLKGALQQAIDATNINDPLRTTDLQLDVEDFKATFEIRNGQPTGLIADHIKGDLLFGVPGYLTQADLLARLGDVLTVRSDTFLIRAYGEALNPGDGNVKARAWCEMEVQRVPRYSDPTQDPTTRPPDLNEQNRRLGRQFVITNFRWLREDDL